MIATEQHIFRLHIAMNHFLLMQILQGAGNLIYIGNYRRER